MMRSIVLGMVAAATAMAVPAAAQENRQVKARYTPIFNRCIATGDAERGVTSAIVTCLSDEYRRQDGRLNRVYKITMGRLGSRGKSALRTAQRQWLRDTAATCDRAMKKAEGGTLANVLYADCQLTETIKRTIWLENYRKR